ncbi:HpcH/HpaI aldolase/citrate lyase family protein [Ammoniphilus sp. YIM 78166]|uniref:HpcH/HpaI aldolase family protein n=1 Tax=Ammoniphilus sp. YIM 78166 TaxID=1644106 RepID=UPI00143113D8|nr:aldolase/citrate lyase family protein [Ammoniphilus sp. YIM 78166]
MSNYKEGETTFKTRVFTGDSQLGTFVKIYSLELIEILGLSGFDFIVIDMEHTTLSYDKVEHMVRTADLYDMASIVRIPDSEESTILHALDLGAIGIQVPQINNRADVESIVQAAKYPPHGTRGVTYAHRAAKFGFKTGKSYMQEANERNTIAVHIETVSAFNQVDAICSVEGLDIVFIGPVDLSIALNLSSDYVSGEMSGPVQTILESCRTHGKQPGIMVNNEREYRYAMEQNIPYIVWGSDIAVFKQAATGIKHLQERIRHDFLKV